MKFEEKHKEFVVKCYAQFMSISDSIGAFEDDTPQKVKAIKNTQ